ncbi:MAG: discoidin domain-containing protein [Okeania sp. SIO3B3]|nr:discoidin domain-containing protein [Okeania sp. SIO3B3]
MVSLKPLFLLTAIAGSLTSLINPVQAAQIIQPQSALTDLGESGSSILDRAINQSGLSVNYTNGVTDFQDYLSGNPTHSFLGSTWVSQLTLPGSVTFDLGSVFDLDAIAMWGTSGLFSAENFELFASLTGEDGSFVSLGSFVQNLESGNETAQVFNFSTTTAQFIRMDITSSHIFNNRVGIGEVAFSGSNVTTQTTPEPASLVALLGLGGLGFTSHLKKRK